MSVEKNGIVFLDEIDKICAKSERHGGDVSREGVQRDLLPLIEGTTVSTKHGAVKHRSHPVHRVRRLPRGQAVGPAARAARAACPSGSSSRRSAEADFKRILREPENSLIRQYIALMGTEGVDARVHGRGHRRAGAISPPR